MASPSPAQALGASWLATVETTASDATVRALVTELAVEPAQRYQVNKWLPAVSVDESDLARRAFLDVAIRGTGRRLAQVTAALSDPDLAATETITRASEMMLLTARKKDLAAQADTLPGLT